MRKLFLFIATLLIFSTKAQFKSTEKLIGELNNDQFMIDHEHKADFQFESKAAKQLIRKGKKNSKFLLSALEDSTKTIMAHLVLCHIYFGKVSFAGPKIVSEGDHNVYKYYLGEENSEGLLISEVRTHGSYRKYVSQNALEKIKKYWEGKMK